jgi:hypothetical protein
MGNHTSNSHSQQLPNHHTTKAKAADTTQNNEATPSQKHRKQQKMGYIYLFFTTHTENH